MTAKTESKIYTRMGTEVELVARILERNDGAGDDGSPSFEWIRVKWIADDPDDIAHGTVNDYPIWELRGEYLFEQVAELPVIDGNLAPERENDQVALDLMGQNTFKVIQESAAEPDSGQLVYYDRESLVESFPWVESLLEWSSLDEVFKVKIVADITSLTIERIF